LEDRTPRFRGLEDLQGKGGWRMGGSGEVWREGGRRRRREKKKKKLKKK
jgi:hypothetical protein